MHGSNLPFRYWFVAIHLLTSTKKSFSAAELQRQFGHKRYEPIWYLLHKLRSVMGKRDEQYQLSGLIELDEGFFTTEISEEEKKTPLKRGRGSQRKSKVLVMAESTPVEEEKSTRGGKQGKVNRIKIIVIPDLKASTITPLVEENVSCETAIDSDDSASYVELKDIAKEHNPQVITKEEVGKILPWVHIAIGNAKRQFLNIYHQMDSLHLQNYLNEFCYKFNRRYFGENLFDRLMLASVSYKNEFRYNYG